MAASDDSFSVITHGFSALKILVIDASISAAQNTRMLLSTNGVTAVEIARTADEVMEQLGQGKCDMLIAEWDMKNVSGIELTKRIRLAQSPAKPSIPIILLTGRGHPAAAQEALNAGVNEVYVRPLSPQGMARVIHTVVTQPRSFVVAPTYRGPDRRTLHSLSQGDQDNRIQQVPSIVTLSALETYAPALGAQLILPDFSLKAKINRAAIASGKVSFEMIENEFIHDGLSDVGVLKQMFHDLGKTMGPQTPIDRMCSASNLVRARSDAYDYELASKVAGFLTDFCTRYFDVNNAAHTRVLEKHIQALQTILKTKVRGNGGRAGEELITDLGRLMIKMM